MLAPSQAHILVIDDTPEAIRPLLLALRGRHWRVSVATDARQGQQRAQLLAPDLILLDVRMPGMDGFALCRLLQASPRTRDIPVLFLTSAGAADERLEGLSQGGVDYIMKTCEPAELLARVQIHLQLARRRAAAVDDTPAPPLSPDEVVLRAAMRLIGQQLAELPPLEAIAARVGTHDKKLSAIFRRHLGMTVFAWVREERLRRGRELLADPLLSMQEIAGSVGFRSACNFTTAFRERMGVTPSQYRKGLQDGAAGKGTPAG
ncbi:AraC family transcriptional regulator [Frateuria sp. Soil773]|uniref:response regulator transcription factor n=1 Tax=Frateuria sp. Soil773 TaxID=1736407 RepID=UPI0007002EA3|nr:DNA-binding response regulator [Frateuria sp. Soil773]KRF02209.1 AraC family transcriptional regulator [Frateuria sp. Soil773]